MIKSSLKALSHISLMYLHAQSIHRDTRAGSKLNDKSQHINLQVDVCFIGLLKQCNGVFYSL